jgi:glycosyltransferase involved in cell wall biosynthesis
MPTISVVIPTFRGGRYLREAVASVAAQTFEDWELIVVADGCTELFSDIEKTDHRVRIVRQPRRGASIARNVGIGLAQSELVALLDDDDRMIPERLVSQLEAMSDKRVGLCHTQFRIINDEGTPIGLGSSTESQYRDFLLGDGGIMASSVMIRKSVFQAVGGFNSLLYLGEDIDLFYRIARESEFKFLPDVLAEYRTHRDNTWFRRPSSGREIKLILTQHLWAAENHGDADDVQAIRHGLAYLPQGRAARAIVRAHAARTHHNYLALIWALGSALVFAPRVTIKLVLRDARRHRTS